MISDTTPEGYLGTENEAVTREASCELRFFLIFDF